MKNFLTYATENRFIPFFEANGSGGGGTDEPTPSEEPTPKKDDDTTPQDKGKKAKTGKTYTDEELDAIISKKFAKWKTEEEKRIKEAEKLAGMSAAEKAQMQMEEALKRAEEAEAKLTRLSMIKEARTILDEKSISVPDSLLEYLVRDDAESTKENIDTFAEVWTTALEAEVKKALKRKTPKTGGSTTITKEDIRKIKDTQERQRAYAEYLSNGGA